VAGSFSIFVGFFSSNVGDDTSIPTGGALGESSNGYDELPSLSSKNSVGGDPKVESGSNEPSPLSRKRSGGRRFEGGIRGKVLVSMNRLFRL
jgi:hypothetical protein